MGGNEWWGVFSWILWCVTFLSDFVFLSDLFCMTLYKPLYTIVYTYVYMETKVYSPNQHNTLVSTIPKEIKYLLGLEEGDKIDWEYNPNINKVVIKKIRQ